MTLADLASEAEASVSLLSSRPSGQPLPTLVLFWSGNDFPTNADVPWESPGNAVVNFRGAVNRLCNVRRHFNSLVLVCPASEAALGYYGMDQTPQGRSFRKAIEIVRGRFPVIDSADFLRRVVESGGLKDGWHMSARWETITALKTFVADAMKLISYVRPPRPVGWTSWRGTHGLSCSPRYGSLSKARISTIGSVRGTRLRRT